MSIETGTRHEPQRRESDRKPYPFVTLDVFTSQPFEGNPLAVFTDAGELTPGQMQSTAREMNLSETTFIQRRMPDVEREKGMRVRIFTVSEELPFAGHPTLGTAYVLRGHRDEKEVRLDLNVGTIPVTFSDREGGLFGEMRQNDPQFGMIHAREEVARAAGLAIEDISDDVPIQTVSTGNAFVIVPLRSLEVAGRLAPSWPSLAQYAAATKAKFIYFVSRDAETAGASLHARMFFYNGEDPATGSAADPAWPGR
jgi:trans-2,3-dihydro-3-hydroxyanthranilate isomerase